MLEIARLFGVATSTVNGWIVAGVLPATNVAGPKAKRRSWRITESDIAEFQKKRSNQN
ncbi:MAG: helix-turn-helix domain-containing protein [Planctomyces sp.]